MKERSCAIVLCLLRLCVCLLHSLPSSLAFELLLLMSTKVVVTRPLKKRKRELKCIFFAAPACKSVRRGTPMNIDKHKTRLSDQSGAGDRRLRRFRVKSRSLRFRLACPYKPDSPTRNGFEPRDSSAYPLADLRRICYGESCSRSSSRIATYSRNG